VSAKAGPSRPKAQTDVELDSDSDEPVFVGETIGAKLAARFTFNDGIDRIARATPASTSGSRSRSTSVAAGRKRKSLEKAEKAGTGIQGGDISGMSEDKPGTPREREAMGELAEETRREANKGKERSVSVLESDSGKEDKAKVKIQRKPRLEVNDVLLPTLDIEPMPIPDWLGQPVVLKQLSNCPLCKRQLKQSESGPARWVSATTLGGEVDSSQQRHISSCFRPLYRPPNTPPDLRKIISDALEALNETMGPVSLIDYHVRAIGESTSTEDASSRLHGSKPPKTGKKPKLKPKTGPVSLGLRVVTVKSADERENWDDQVDEKVAEFLGHPSPSSVRSGNKSLPPSSPGFPPTQPLGASELAGDYLHPDRVDSPPPQTPNSPAAQNAFLLDDGAMDMPPSSQGRGSVWAEEDDTEGIGAGDPFPQWGDSRADGTLSRKKRSAGAWNGGGRGSGGDGGSRGRGGSGESGGTGGEGGHDEGNRTRGPPS